MSAAAHRWEDEVGTHNTTDPKGWSPARPAERGKHSEADENGHESYARGDGLHMLVVAWCITAYNQRTG